VTGTQPPIRMAVVGLHFGAKFFGIYQRHPLSQVYALCQRTEPALTDIGDYVGVPRRYRHFDDLLADPDVEAVHLNTPFELHTDQAVAALEAGKHVLCAPPAALTLADCERLVQAQRRSGRVYMLAETDLFTDPALRLRDLYRRGRLGSPRLLNGFHLQDMTGWPDYWYGFPPLMYSSHALAPILDIGDWSVASIAGFGVGKPVAGPDGDSYTAELAVCRLAGESATLQLTVDLLGSAGPFRKGFDADFTEYGFEWRRGNAAADTCYSGGEQVDAAVPRTADTLPPELSEYPLHRVYGCDRQHFATKTKRAGTHAVMVDEFLRAIREGRPSRADAVRAAHWTAVGIVGHASAVGGAGEPLPVPVFE
jgi:predicted dehydrogenase